MQHFHRLTQAYTQAPWRKQQQAIGVFLLTVVSFALVAYIYLNISERTSTKGRWIQSAQVRMEGAQRVDYVATAEDEGEKEELPIEELKIEIAYLENRLAYLRSGEVMRERAKGMGFQPVDPGEVLYLEAPGYKGRLPAQLALPARTRLPEVVSIDPAFKEPLFKWMERQLDSLLNMARKGVSP